MAAKVQKTNVTSGAKYVTSGSGSSYTIKFR